MLLLYFVEYFVLEDGYWRLLITISSVLQAAGFVEV